MARWGARTNTGTAKCGAQPQILSELDGSAERLRTSGGEAAPWLTDVSDSEY